MLLFTLFRALTVMKTPDLPVTLLEEKPKSWCQELRLPENVPGGNVLCLVLLLDIKQVIKITKNRKTTPKLRDLFYRLLRANTRHRI